MRNLNVLPYERQFHSSNIHILSSPSFLINTRERKEGFIKRRKLKLEVIENHSYSTGNVYPFGETLCFTFLNLDLNSPLLKSYLLLFHFKPIETF